MYTIYSKKKIMAKPSAFDKERLAHINNLMAELHDSCNDIYEHLVDRDFKQLTIEVNKLISNLNDIKISIDDE